MPTTRTGEKITWKEFFKRWRWGIEQEVEGWEEQIKEQIGDIGEKE